MASSAAQADMRLVITLMRKAALVGRDGVVLGPPTTACCAITTPPPALR
jgi:hypothetical protein